MSRPIHARCHSRGVVATRTWSSRAISSAWHCFSLSWLSVSSPVSWFSWASRGAICFKTRLYCRLAVTHTASGPEADNDITRHSRHIVEVGRVLDGTTPSPKVFCPLNALSNAPLPLQSVCEPQMYGTARVRQQADVYAWGAACTVTVPTCCLAGSVRHLLFKGRPLGGHQAVQLGLQTCRQKQFQTPCECRTL